MKRSELEHLIRAAGSIADDTDIVVIGSQAILGQFPDAPLPLLVSAEADLFPCTAPNLLISSMGVSARARLSMNSTAITRKALVNEPLSFHKDGGIV